MPPAAESSLVVGRRGAVRAKRERAERRAAALSADGNVAFVSLAAAEQAATLHENLRAHGLSGVTLRGDAPLWLGARTHFQILKPRKPRSTRKNVFPDSTTDAPRHSIEPARPARQPMTRAIEACVHCGFCLAVCPTYQQLGQEMDSPRGRIVLMKEVLEGKLSWEAAQPHVDRCLGAWRASRRVRAACRIAI